MAIFRTTIAVSGATGGAGVATANAKSPMTVEGEIQAIYLEYLDSPPAGTTDVTIAEANNSPALPVFTVANAATDGWFYPSVIPVSIANAAITNGHRPVKVADVLIATIEGANDADGVNVTIVWDDLRG